MLARADDIAPKESASLQQFARCHLYRPALCFSGASRSIQDKRLKQSHSRMILPGPVFQRV